VLIENNGIFEFLHSFWYTLPACDIWTCIVTVSHFAFMDMLIRDEMNILSSPVVMMLLYVSTYK